MPYAILNMAYGYGDNFAKALRHRLPFIHKIVIFARKPIPHT
jgi:hypothetical protein